MTAKQWHVWRVAYNDSAMDVVSCGGQQARKVAAALWVIKYADTHATCVSRALSRAEGHGPRLAQAGLLERFSRY
jgi:hypothetical protein